MTQNENEETVEDDSANEELREWFTQMLLKMTDEFWDSRAFCYEVRDKDERRETED